MAFIAALSILLAGHVRADADLSVFEACIGPELEPRARLIGYTSSCAATNDCNPDPDEDASEWHDTVEINCFGAQIDRCGIAERPAECFAAFSDALTADRATIIAAIPSDRVDHAVSAGGPRGRSIERYFEGMLLAPSEVDCPTFARVAERRLGLVTGTICKSYQHGSDWLQARMFFRMLERREVRMEDEAASEVSE